MNYHEKYEQERFRSRVRAALIAHYRERFEMIFAIASKPIKFPAPARRRRQDRELPKAA